MQFPVSREYLLRYKTDIKMKKAVDDRVAAVVAAICSGVQETLTQTDKRRFVYDATSLLIFQSLRAEWRDTSAVQELIVGRVMSELNMKFIGCDVIMDPLMKTITVSWAKQGPGDWHG